MKALILTLLFCGLVQAQSQAAQYPKICGSKGKAWVEARGGAPVLVKANEILHERAAFKTEKGALICLDLSSSDRVILNENSRLNIPFIELESGAVPELFLESGIFRLVSESGASRALASDLFRENVRNGDFVISFDRENVVGTMDVLAGESRFRGLENEDFVDLVAGESASFKGDAVEGQIQYDILLKGKRVARGTLSPKKSLSPKEVAALRQNLQFVKARVRVEESVVRVEDPQIKGRSQSKKSGKMICSKPPGLFNECAWICEKNPKGAKRCLTERANVKCIRQRCNANGEWDDRFEYSKDRSVCQAKTTIKACDY